MSLKEELKAKKLIDIINPEIAQVKLNIIKSNFFGSEALTREKMEKSHILIINHPRKKISQNEFYELIDYIDIGGTLFLSLPKPPWTNLGRWFGRFIDELGISFQSEYVYGIPKIPLNLRLIGTELQSHRAHIIEYRKNQTFKKEHGIEEYIPIALVDNKPIILAANKRRGRFVIFSSLDTFRPENSMFFNLLLRINSQKKSLQLGNEKKIEIGKSKFYFQIQHAALDRFLLSLYHHEFRFHREIITFTSNRKLAQHIFTIITNQKVLSKKPEKEEVLKALEKTKLEKD